VRVTLVTSNPGKFAEVRELLAPFGISVRWDHRALPEIQADDLDAVVESKLQHAVRGDGPVLVEDSGLFIPALRGFPGVYSAYVYRTVGLEGVLALVERKPRRAVFRTVAGVAIGGRKVRVGGESRGTLSRRPRGRGGFGFDPIFVPSGKNQTFAEMSLEAKNRLSHRARAMRRVGTWLRAHERLLLPRSAA
jgi:XTP/dITP diphosphohydrolase